MIPKLFPVVGINPSGHFYRNAPWVIAGILILGLGSLTAMTATCIREYIWSNLLNRVGNWSSLASHRELFLWPKMPIHVISYMLVVSPPLDVRLAMQ